MATVAATARFEDTAELRASPVLGAFLSASFENDSQLVAVLGANLRAARVSFTSTSDLTVSGRMRYAGAVRFDNDAILVVAVTSGPQALEVAAVTFDNPTEMRPRLVSNSIGSVRMDDESELRVIFAPYIPTIQPPTPDQDWGTVNFVRNGSLEDAGAGLLDWSVVTTGAMPDPVLIRSTATAWDRDTAGLASLPAGAGSDYHGVKIRTQAGLNYEADSGYWAASAQVYTPDLTILQWWIHLVYIDGTEDTSDVLYATTAGDVDEAQTLLQSEWQPVGVTVPQDPGKPVNYAELFVATTGHGADAILRVDAVQIEDARAGGPTTYADGDQGDGHHWLGTPGQSMSWRETA